VAIDHGSEFQRQPNFDPGDTIEFRPRYDGKLKHCWRRLYKGAPTKGARFYQAIAGATTVGEAIRLAELAKIDEVEAQGHLRWAFVVGALAVNGAPNPA
jgi:hypothetical protein